MLFLMASLVIFGRGFLAGWEEFGRSSSPCLPGSGCDAWWLAVPLRRTVGGPETMREQLEHLTGISRANRSVIQVLTFAAGAHPGMDGSFEILRFPEPADPDAVYSETAWPRAPPTTWPSIPACSLSTAGCGSTSPAD
jgi:hypothetical protein